MSERRVGLDLGMPSGASVGADPGGARPGEERPEADAGLAQRFREQLAQGAAPPPEAPPAARPFDLFGAARAPEAQARPEPSKLAEMVEQSASRMLVSGGAGEAAVRIRLKDDLLPGTEVRIAQRDGRLEIEFVATEAASGTWLAAQSESIAGEVSRRLRRDVRVLVKREDAEGTETLADRAGESAPDLPSGPASLFGTRRGERDGGEEGP